jgi:hypothetical protein
MLTLTGNKCVLNGFQIVNGCQTSTVLYNQRKHFDEDHVLVPIKLVSTENEEIVNAIIRATNSMTDFQKHLEAYYRTFKGTGALYYERRSKQWVSSPVEKTRVVTIPNQIKAIASMFLDVPHRVSGYYGTVRSRIADKIFRPEHKYIPYYASALTLYRLDTLFRNRVLESSYKPLRWYLLMLFRKALVGDSPTLGSNAIEKYCEGILKHLKSSESAALVFQKVVKALEDKGVIQSGSIDKDALKTQTFRDRLIEAVKPQA